MIQKKKIIKKYSAQDVSTIDLNCGCPKRFSIHGGMGAALMEEPEKLCGVRLYSLYYVPKHVSIARKDILQQQASILTICRSLISIAKYIYIYIYIDLEEFGRQLWTASDMQDQDLS